MELKSIMLNFLDNIKEFSSLKPNLLHVQKLQMQLSSISHCTFLEHDAQLLMECILKYIDFIINISASKRFRDQINICKKSFSIVTEIVSEQMQTAFVKAVTKRVFDIIIEDDVKSWCVKKELLKAYISCIQDSDKSVRQEAVHELPNIYLFKMIDSISTYGDYDLQVTLIETVFRMYGKTTITSKLKDLIPESQLLSESFAEINGDTFDEDVRKFLNALNETSGKVYSVICKSVHLGDIKCGEPTENGLWVDFNLSENAITWYCNKNSLSDKRMDAENLNETDNKVWNLVTLFVSDVESVQIYRPLKNEDVLIFFKFKESCISSFNDNQAIVGAANNLKLVVSRGSKKIAVLLSKVLPSMFKNKFFHNSSKVSTTKKSVYKPLNVKVSRKTKSDSSKTRSDTSSFVNIFDPFSARSSKNDLNSTTRSLNKVLSVSSMSPKCEVISIPDSSSPTTELSLEFVSVKDHNISKNIQRSIGNESEVTENCRNTCFEAKEKVSKDIQDKDKLNINRMVGIKISKAKTNSSISTNSSLNDEFLSVQEDIDHIQILSRRCSGSNMRYSQLSNKSKLTTSTPRKLSSCSRSYDIEIKNIYSGQSMEDITKWNKIKIQESSTGNFQTAEENSQNLNKPPKISITADVLEKTDICRETLVVKESNTQNFETADDGTVPNETVTLRDPQHQYVYEQNFQDCDLNLNKSIKISKPKDVSKKTGMSNNRRCTINTEIHKETDLCNPNKEVLISEELVTDIIISKSEGSFSKIHTDLNVEKEFESTEVKIPQLNQETVVNCGNENDPTCEISQDIEKDLAAICIEKPVYSVSNERDAKPIRKRTYESLDKENEKAIAKVDVKNNILKENISGKSKSVNTCHKTRIKSNPTMTVGFTKKKKKMNKPLREDSNKENIEKLKKIDPMAVGKIIQETELQKYVKPREFCIEEDNKNDQISTSKKVLYNEDNEKYGISSKEIILAAALDTDSKRKTSSPDNFDEKSCNKQDLYIQCTKLIDQENIVQEVEPTQGESVDVLKKSNDGNIKENQSNNDLINEKCFPNSLTALTYTDDILSEDEIPLKQLMRKWEIEKLKKTQCREETIKGNQNLQPESKEINLKMTENCERAVDDSKNKTVIENINTEKENLQLPIVDLENDNIKHFHNRISENPQTPLDLKTITKSCELVEMNKQANNLSKIVPSIRADKINNKGKKRSDEKQVTDWNKNKTINNVQILEETHTKGADTNKSDTTRDLNQTISTTLGTRKKRKLYNPGDLTYLEEPSIWSNFPTKHNSEITDINNFEGKNKAVPINDRNIKRPRKSSKTIKSSKKLKIVNPDFMLKFSNDENKRYKHLRPIFHNLLESFRKEITPKKEKVNKDKYRKSVSKKTTKHAVKNKLTKFDIVMRAEKTSILSSSSSDLSLNLEKDVCMNNDLDTSLSEIDSPPKLQIEKGNNEKKINIISNIQIRPRRVLLKDKTELPKKKINNDKFDINSNIYQEASKFENFGDPLQIKNAYEEIIPIKMGEAPNISETMTHEEINSWITTGSQKYSQFSEKYFVLKHCYPLFRSLLKPKEKSREYSDVVTICNILKKYV